MKKYSFSLSKVLRVRKIQEEQAAARLAAAQLVASAAATRAAESRHALAARCGRQGLQSSAAFLAWAETAMLAGEAFSAAKAEAVKADEEVEECRGEWSSAAARVSALEHLDERGRVAHTVERRRDEAKTADDIVNTRGHHQPPPERTRWERP